MSRLTGLVADLARQFGHPALDPIDVSAPRGTQIRRIAAHNALFELARLGRDRYCGATSPGLTGPCILREGHPNAEFDRDTTHMDVEQRDRARRYLVHSDPDPGRRA